MSASAPMPVSAVLDETSRISTNKPANNVGIGRGRLLQNTRTPSPKSAEPSLTKTDLVQWFKSGCKPKSQWRIGTEHEKILFSMADHKRATYPQIEKMLHRVIDEHGWNPIMEGKNIIGCELDGQSITLEPGGQFELSGAPVETLHQVAGEVTAHLEMMNPIAADLGLAFLGTGLDPKWTPSQVPVMPKHRYKLIADSVLSTGDLGLDLMYKTCSTQVNLDYSSEEDMVQKLRVSLALQSVATALFANSPFSEGKPNGWKSFRSHTYLDFDHVRAGWLPFVFEEGFGFERYVDYLLDTPMYALFREEHGYLNVIGMSFRDFMDGKLPALPGERPTLVDWQMQVGSVYPEVRMKKFLEMRGADCGDKAHICALPALWVGLLYDSQALQEAYELIADFTTEDMDHLRHQVPVLGLQAPFRAGTVQDLARRVLDISLGGLKRRGLHEEGFLQELVRTVETGMAPADRLLKSFDEDWGYKVDPVFEYGRLV